LSDGFVGLAFGFLTCLGFFTCFDFLGLCVRTVCGGSGTCPSGAWIWSGGVVGTAAGWSPAPGSAVTWAGEGPAAEGAIDEGAIEGWARAADDDIDVRMPSGFGPGDRCRPAAGVCSVAGVLDVAPATGLAWGEAGA
jgi:hypothetical protein